ncbi:MAG: hypothetical protein MK188_13115 [Gammaproteobacteria bacterium]|nr:hypothetical protein [Gammaproteobacteria bacterium]
MFLLSNALKSLINALPEFSVSIPFGHMKGTNGLPNQLTLGRPLEGMN